MDESISHTVINFRGLGLPEAGTLVGYAALIEQLDLQVPLPSRLSAISKRHHPRSTENWQLFTPRHAPADTLGGQIQFALKWEGVQLGVLAALFRAVAAEDIAAIIRKTPTGPTLAASGSSMSG